MSPNDTCGILVSSLGSHQYFRRIFYFGLNNHSVTVVLCGDWGGFLILPSSEEASSDKECISVFTACGFQNARQLSTVNTL